MDAARKKRADAILIGIGHAPPPSKEMEEEPDESAAVEDAMSALLDAIKARDPKAMADAFKTASKLCDVDDEDEEEPEDVKE